MKIGDRVINTEEVDRNFSAVGQKGTIISRHKQWGWGVRFDFQIDNGHDLHDPEETLEGDLQCDYGYGWWIPESKLKLDEVEVVKQILSNYE